jgi:lysophospholipase L1-like esterase
VLSSRLLRLLSRVLFVIQLVVLGLIARQWANVTTQRLYLDHERGVAAQSTVTQRFDLEGRHVIPRIVTRQGECLSFPNPLLGAKVDLHTGLQPVRPVHYTVAWRTDAGRQILASGLATAQISVSRRLPATPGTLELETDGPATWTDPRLVRGMRVGGNLVELLVLLLMSWALNTRMPAAERTSARVVWLRAAALTAACVASVLACEVALRAFGDHAPAGVLALRRDMGEAVPDERWEDTPAYGRRLRARVDTENEWRYGDIVRMGFVPAAVGPGVRHRFPFSTDAEGFRNRVIRDRVGIAALGDSFTDAMTVPAEASWPARLEQRLGIAVQNYGTAGFGPQQELLVLRDFVVRHRPARVVLAYFAGNDLFDAERFDRFMHDQATPQTLGWPIKDVYSRADTWYVTSALTASAGWLARRQQPFVVSAAAGGQHEQTVRANTPFDRGLFSLTVGGKLLQWAFMPPYLNTLNFSERELRARSGWRLTQTAILAMQQTSRDAGAEFAVMFLPFKSQVYWPLLEQRLTPAELHRALTFYLEDNGRPIDVDAMRRNRLAQNTMMRELCASAGIPFLDTTPVLQRRVEAGDNVYFPDDSHFNELGQDIVAEALAGFLDVDRR